MIKNMYSDKDYQKSNYVLKAKTPWIMVAILFSLFLQGFDGLAQSARKTITGRVTSAADNSGMPGVSVVVKGTTTGASTDAEGNFSLEATSSDVLVISFIGYINQEVPVGNNTTINVSLREDAEVLNEVVVTGYGELRRSDMTGAQTTISSVDIERTINTSVEQALQGRAAGVYVTQNTGAPGGGISVNIRGVSSINGNTEPLYVIDGVQIQGSQVEYGAQSSSNPLATLNPADIESMEVLQGPSATALYGSRGTNGVVLITTKRGQAGDIRINYGYLYSIQTAPKNLEVMNLRQYAQMSREYHEIEGGTTPEEFLDPSLLGEGTDWQGELFKSAPLQKHSLSLSGGNEKTLYYFSGEYFDQQGIALGSGFDRFSTRLNLDSKPKDWLDIGVNVSYAQTNTQLSTNQDNIIQRAIQLTPQVPVRNFDGSWGGGNEQNGANQYTPVNPIALANLNTNDQVRRQLLGGLNVGFHILEGLDFRTSLNTNIAFTSSTLFQPAYTIGNQSRPTTNLNESTGLNTYWNWNQLMQYTRDFGKHSFNVMVSHEAQAWKWKNLSAGRQGFIVTDILDLNMGDPLDSPTNGGGQGDGAIESYLGRINYNFSDRYIIQGAFRADGSANFGPENRWGYFPSVSAAWRISEEPFFDVPFLDDLRLRYEIGLTGNTGPGGAIYGALSSNATQWGTGFLPTRYANPSLQWEETLTNNFGINIAFLQNRVQLEADYYIKNTDNLLLENPLPWYMGTTGQGSIAPPTVNIGGLQNKGWSFQLNTVNVDNSRFKWESNLNLSHFKARITEFYSESAYVDRTTRSLDGQSGVAWTQRADVGQAPWLFYGYVQEGIFQSIEELESSALVAVNGQELPIAQDGIWVGDVKYKDINGDGLITVDDQTFIGNPWPKLFAGFTNSFSYKGFDLSVLITSTIGNDIYNFVAFRNTNPNNINLSQNLLVDAFDYAKVAYPADDVNQERPYLLNPGTSVARIDPTSLNENFTRHTSKYVEDGSFVRLKNVSLNYNIPSTILAKQKYVRAARIGVSAQNVATLTGYSGYDPEVGSYVGRDVQANQQAIGVDNGRYPLTPIYSFNIGIDF